MNAPSIPGRLVARWPNGWSVSRVDSAIGSPLRQGLGPWLVRSGLYAQGADFSSNEDGDPSYKGTSTLLKVWTGEAARCEEGMSGIRLFILARKGRPQGVVAWLHADTDGVPGPSQWFDKEPDHPRYRPRERLEVCRLGHLMAFLKPGYRGLGLVRRTVRDLIVPELEAAGSRCVDRGVTPTVGASNAMRNIVESTTSLPVVEPLWVCLGMRRAIWSMLARTRMAPERPDRSARWFGAPEAIKYPDDRRRRTDTAPTAPRPHTVSSAARANSHHFTAERPLGRSPRVR